MSDEGRVNETRLLCEVDPRRGFCSSIGELMDDTNEPDGDKGEEMRWLGGVEWAHTRSKKSSVLAASRFAFSR